MVIIARKRNGLIYYYCRDCNTRKLRIYRKTNKGKERTYEAIKRSEKRYPERGSAWNKLKYALLNKKIKKSKECQKCFRKEKLYGHHPDYAKPLEVVWMCRGCHADEHRKINIVNNS